MNQKLQVSQVRARLVSRLAVKKTDLENSLESLVLRLSTVLENLKEVDTEGFLADLTILNPAGEIQQQGTTIDVTCGQIHGLVVAIKELGIK
jgi:hypothetical protein